MRLAIKLLFLTLIVVSSALYPDVVGGKADDVELCRNSLIEFEGSCSTFFVNYAFIDYICENIKKPVCSVPMQNKYRRRDFPGCRNVIFQSEIYSLEYHDLYYTILKYACVRNEKGEVCPYFYENFRLNKDTANLLDGIPSYTESVKQTCSDKLCTEYTKDLLKVAIDTYAEIVKSLMNENTKGFTELAGRYKRDRQLYINTLNSIENNNCTLTEKDFEYYDTSNAITTKKLSTYLVSFVGLLLLLYLH